MDPDNHKPKNENTNDQKTADTDKAGDFLGHEHGNAMPENETSTDKILNQEDTAFKKNKPGANSPDDGNPSIH